MTASSGANGRALILTVKALFKTIAANDSRRDLGEVEKLRERAEGRLGEHHEGGQGDFFIYYIFYIYFKVGKEIVEDATRQGVKYMEVIIAEVVMMVQTFHFQGWY